MSFKAKCNTCLVIADCKHAFGKYWVDKSSGGIGCMHPFAGWNTGKPQMPTMPKMPRRPKMPTRPVRSTQLELRISEHGNCNGGDCERAQLCAEPCAGCAYCDETGNL